jgi:hypothetical protein
MTALASVQATSLDVMWIREGVVCLGHRTAERCYRAALAVEGPREAFAHELERVQPVLDGFAGFLNAIGQPSIVKSAALQILVRAELGDLSEYAARLESRAQVLSPHLATEALADTVWARKNGSGLGLLPRRGYLVIPAESLPGADMAGRLGTARSRFWRWVGSRPALDETEARRALTTRCSELVDRLARGGVWGRRLDDPSLTRLFQACWSSRRDLRFEQDLRICATSGADRRP